MKSLYFLCLFLIPSAYAVTEAEISALKQQTEENSRMIQKLIAKIHQDKVTRDRLVGDHAQFRTDTDGQVVRIDQNVTQVDGRVTQVLHRATQAHRRVTQADHRVRQEVQGLGLRLRVCFKRSRTINWSEAL